MVARLGARRNLVITASAVAALVAGVLLAQSAPTMAPRSGGETARQRADLERRTGQQQSRPEARRTRPRAFIERPSSTPRIVTGKLDTLGRDVTVSCASCHANFQPNSQLALATELDEFHQGLTFEHGNLLCGSCHQPPNYSALRLADNRTVEYGEVQQLCSQCHAKQASEYEHGAHGGMNGHWDLSRGSRRRHGCIDCHDPHAPRFPSMLRTFHSLDRFLSPDEKDAAHD